MSRRVIPSFYLKEIRNKMIKNLLSAICRSIAKVSIELLCFALYSLVSERKCMQWTLLDIIDLPYIPILQVDDDDEYALVLLPKGYFQTCNISVRSLTWL